MPITRCTVCHRRLTDPYSVAVGVGPECRGKYPKNHFPKPRWRVRRGKMELVDLIPQGNSTCGNRDEGDEETEAESCRN
jgi:hypothetical protein